MTWWRKVLRCSGARVLGCQVFVRVANIFALKIMWKTVVWFNFNYSTVQQQLGGNYVRFAVCCIWGHAAAPYECVITHMRQSLKRPKADVDGVAPGSATVGSLRGHSSPHMHFLSLSLSLFLPHLTTTKCALHKIISSKWTCSWVFVLILIILFSRLKCFFLKIGSES